MGRKIVVLSDGTGNAAGKLFRTNVWRVYQALDLSTDRQIAFYDDGVGNSSIKPLAVVGGALGWGLKRNIIDLYTFLCENYREGDQIHGFGFSRGAFTIRVLAKFVLSQGLVKTWDSTDDLKRQARTLYRRFRSERKTRFGLATLGRLIRDGLLYTASWIVHFSPPKEPQVVHPKFEFLGLWDTVDAYGLPIYELKIGIDRYLWPLALEDRDFDPKQIRYVCHALSIDDRRTTFHPLLWDESRKTFASRPKRDRERLNQVWFAGVHANLGGGYPDDALSYVSLRWMLREAIRHGLVFNEIMLQQYLATATPYGTLYDSRSGLGAYYRYDPRKLSPPTDNQGAEIRCPKIHESVFQRMAGGSDEYAPLSLPNDFKVVRVSAEELDLVKFQRDVVTGKGRRKAPEIVDFEQLSLPASNQAGRGENGRRLERPDGESLEIVWDTVFWRRVTYFAALLLSFLLIAFPFFPTFGKTAWTIVIALLVPFVAILAPFAAVANPAVKFLADVAEGFFPSFAKPWISAFQLFPWKVSFLIASIAVFLLLGAMLDRRIKDRARAAWNPKRLEIRIEESIKRASTRRSLLNKTIWIGAALFVASLIAGVAIIRKTYRGLSCVNCHLWWDYVSPVVQPLVTEGVFGQAILYFWIWVIFLFPLWIFAVVWVPRSKPVTRHAKSEVPSMALSVARRCRYSHGLNRAYRLVTGQVVPLFFALIVVVGVVVGVNRIGFSYLDATGSVCQSKPISTYELKPGERARVPFDFRSGCTPLTITMAIQPGEDSEKVLVATQDSKLLVAFLPDPEKGYSRSIGGYNAIKPIAGEWYASYLVSALTPFRRNLLIGWFRPILRIDGGLAGFDEQEIGIKFTEIKSSGFRPLSVYINDAVFGIPSLWDLSYRANRFSGFVVIKRVHDDVSVIEEEEQLQQSSPLR